MIREVLISATAAIVVILALEFLLIRPIMSLLMSDGG